MLTRELLSSVSIQALSNYHPTIQFALLLVQASLQEKLSSPQFPIQKDTSTHTKFSETQLLPVTQRPRSVAKRRGN
jgi:hypothetical protein